MNRTLFVNGPILTMESPVPTDALLVEDGRIVALGTDARNATGATKVDLQGDALLPAFIDPHSHLSAAANSLLQVPLGEVRDFAQLEEAVAGFIRDNHIPAGQWVFGQGYDHNHLTEHAHPTRELLDKAAPNNPVVIQHASGHMGVSTPPPSTSCSSQGAPPTRREAPLAEKAGSSRDMPRKTPL